MKWMYLNSKTGKVAYIVPYKTNKNKYWITFIGEPGLRFDNLKLALKWLKSNNYQDSPI